MAARLHDAAVRAVPDDLRAGAGDDADRLVEAGRGREQRDVVDPERRAGERVGQPAVEARHLGRAVQPVRTDDERGARRHGLGRQEADEPPGVAGVGGEHPDDPGVGAHDEVLHRRVVGHDAHVGLGTADVHADEHNASWGPTSSPR